MNIREKILTETAAAAPFTKDEFLEAVSKRIIAYGEFSFVVDARCADKTYTFDRCPTIPVRWLTLVCSWAEGAGLRVTRNVTYYGVVEYIITL